MSEIWPLTCLQENTHLSLQWEFRVVEKSDFKENPKSDLNLD